MLPRLRGGDFDGALLVALQRVDAAATPEHAATLERRARSTPSLGPRRRAARSRSASSAAPCSPWLRYGRDPVYLDDPVDPHGRPAARPDARPARSFVLAGGPSRRALTTALLDLASRGLIAFREE